MVLITDHNYMLDLDINVDFEATNKPPNLPAAAQIVEQCRRAARAKPITDVRGAALLDDGGAPYAWVKYGPTTSIPEARTQQYVADYVNNIAVEGGPAVRVPAVFFAFRAQGRGYIVMEYVDGEPCRESVADAKRVAAAVQFLITITAPCDQPGPGPIGGGPICHNFFIDEQSSVTYSSVVLLQKHINNILAHDIRPQRVDFGPEVQMYGLRLCPDMRQDNFMKDRDGKIVVINFSAASFLPISFFELALCTPNNFVYLLRRLVVCPPSTHRDALYIASRSLVPYGTNKVGEHITVDLACTFIFEEAQTRTGLPPELRSQLEQNSALALGATKHDCRAIVTKETCDPTSARANCHQGDL